MIQAHSPSPIPGTAAGSVAAADLTGTAGAEAEAVLSIELVSTGPLASGNTVPLLIC